MSKIIRLRGHHFLCILTYRGEGYTEDFVSNFDDIVTSINNGSEIEIVAGVDHICGALRQGAHITCSHAHVCRSEQIKLRDRMALNDIARVLQIPYLSYGQTLKLRKSEIKCLRHHFLHGSIRRACMACSWHGFCSQIAKNGFEDTRLMPSAALR